MTNFQVVFSGEVAERANPDAVRENLARELGIDERKAKQLFSGRTVVVRGHLDFEEAQLWQDKLAELGAICRIKDLSPKADGITFEVDKRAAPDATMRDITAAHLECPRCGHMQLDSSHCARCGVNLDEAFKQRRKEDLLIEKKIRELRAKGSGKASARSAPAPSAPGQSIRTSPGDRAAAVGDRKGVLGWIKRK